jgi:hypothetical protein
MTVQTVSELVVLSPVVDYGKAGYPIHGWFGKGLVSVIPLHIGKGYHYIVE